MHLNKPIKECLEFNINYVEKLIKSSNIATPFFVPITYEEKIFRYSVDIKYFKLFHTPKVCSTIELHIYSEGILNLTLSFYLEDKKYNITRKIAVSDQAFFDILLSSILEDMRFVIETSNKDSLNVN